MVWWVEHWTCKSEVQILDVTLNGSVTIGHLASSASVYSLVEC